MRANLSNLRISPRKVRLVAGLVRGRTIDDALAQLKHLAKRSADPVAKLINSAVANSAEGKTGSDKLVVKDIRVDQARTLKRHRPRAFGRAYRINKRASHIAVELGVRDQVAGVSKKSKSLKPKT